MTFSVGPTKIINKPKEETIEIKRKNSAKRNRSNTAFLFSSLVSGILQSPTVNTTTFSISAIPLTELVESKCHLLNDIYPITTRSCWLSYDIAPPYLFFCFFFVCFLFGFVFCFLFLL